MEKIYSKIEPTALLHIVVRKEDIKEGRLDLIEAYHFLQCAALNLKKGTTFKPHRHIFKDVPPRRVIAQESWIVLQGSVKCTFYDFDNTILAEPILEAGDMSATLGAGHNYLILEDNTKVLEYKTGPYEGQALDKEFI